MIGFTMRRMGLVMEPASDNALEFGDYYGMADNRIGVADLDVPRFLPPGALADPPRSQGSRPIEVRSQNGSRREVPITIQGVSSPP